jgi:hypothetical protein
MDVVTPHKHSDCDSLTVLIIDELPHGIANSSDFSSLVDQNRLVERLIEELKLPENRGEHRAMMTVWRSLLVISETRFSMTVSRDPLFPTNPINSFSNCHTWCGNVGIVR